MILCGKKIRKSTMLEKLKNMMKEQSILKKKLSSFKKASLPKWEGAKCADGSRLFRWIFSLEFHAWHSIGHDSPVTFNTIQ